MRIMKPWIIKKSTYVVQDQWLQLRADSCQTETGIKVDPFYVLVARDWVHVASIYLYLNFLAQGGSA